MLFVAILNLGGYGFFMAIFEEQAIATMDQQLDNDERFGCDVFTIKLPVTNLPYYTNSKDFERKNGEVEIGGVIYNYVKKRIYNDSLEMVCVANKDATRLNTARNEFFKLCNDVQNASKSKKPVTAFKFFSPANYREKRPLLYLYFYNNCTCLSQPCDALPLYYSRVIENPPEYC